MSKKEKVKITVTPPSPRRSIDWVQNMARDQREIALNLAISYTSRTGCGDLDSGLVIRVAGEFERYLSGYGDTTWISASMPDRQLLTESDR